MRFKHLHIENIRSYPTLDLDFKNGVTVISGVNGSGKSSILEACFMGLFGGKVLDNTTLQISDMIRKGSTSAAIILDFEHAGDEYQIEQQFKVSKTGSASNSKSVLRKGKEIIAEQSKGTYDALKKLLNMDEKNFQNCSYIRQGDVDALINAKPKDRQQMIDDLLRLGKLEEYRERAQASKTAVNRVLRQEEERKKEIFGEIQKLKEKNLNSELNKREETVGKINNEIDEKRQKKEKFGTELTLSEAKLKEIENDAKEIKILEKETADLEQKRDEELTKREKVLDEILGKEKIKNEIIKETKQIRKDLNESKEVSQSKEYPEITENNTELFFNAAKENEKAAQERKHKLSEQLALISAEKITLEDEISKKEKDMETVKKSRAEAENQIEKRSESIVSSNASVENGYSKAKMEKEAFSSLFDELFNELKEKTAGSEYLEKAGENKPDTSNVSDMSFYSSLIKAEELPLPSDEKMWDDLISDIERLEELVSNTKEEQQLTEEEKKKAAIKGELEEKEKSIEDMEKEIRRLNEEYEKTESELKAESAEVEKKKKRLSDFDMVLTDYTKGRQEKIKLCPILKEAVPASRYQLNDITAEDIDRAYDLSVEQKEKLMTESASLKSEDFEIEKSIQKKEALLKAGKCPTCGQVVKADENHKEHGTEEEVKRRQEIKIRSEEIKKLQTATELQNKILKEIQEIDGNINKINSEINTSLAEEKGKAELIEKYKKDLEEISRQKTERNARKAEHAVFCDARKKDMESIEKRLLGLREENAKRQGKIKLLSEKKKEFSKSSNSILMDYKTLENEKKSKQEFEKRLEEINGSKAEIEEIIKTLKIKSEKTETESKKAETAKTEAEAELKRKADFTEKAGRLIAFENEKKNHDIFISGHKKTMDQQDTTIDTLKNQISEKKIKIKKTIEKIESVSGFSENLSLEDQKRILTEKINRLSEEIRVREKERDEILQEMGTYRNEIAALFKYEKEAEILRNKIHYISLVSEDVSVLEEMYRRIRADMRSKNIEALDRLLNDMFEFIYSNNAYSHLELDADYNLKVHEKDGSVLEPKQLSGGERAIFNLALRCAIYRLLSLGFGENGAGKNSLPPLIFDEPTVFLDSGHVRQLIHLIEHMKEDGVGQIIVVSHDESLIDSADENFKIEKNTVTNASSAACD